MRTIALAMLLAACVDPRAPGPEGVSRSETIEWLATHRRAVDLLFVVDDSPAMADAQATLAVNAPKLMQVLQQVEGGLQAIDLQIAVTTADGSGALAGTSCLAPGAQWLRRADGPNGVTIRNFDGAIEDVFACMMNVGAAGPPIRQPFESMRRAIVDHVGVARAEAQLYVVFISDGDDCSLRDGVAVPSDPFACTEAAMECDEADLRASGDKHGCRARTGSPLVRDVDEYAQLLASLGPHRAIVAAAVGPAAPVTILDGPRLAPSCTSSAASASPAVRVQALVDALAPAGYESSICALDFSDILTGLASLGEPIGGACFSQPVTDECAVTLIPPVQPAFAIPACDPLAYATPCWTARSDLACPRVVVDLGDTIMPWGTRLRATCVIA